MLQQSPENWQWWASEAAGACRGWPESDLYHVAAVMQAHKYGPNVTVVEQGSDADSMCFIKSGRVRVMRRVPASQSLKEMMEQDPTLRDSVCSPHGRTERQDLFLRERCLHAWCWGTHALEYARVRVR